MDKPPIGPDKVLRLAQKATLAERYLKREKIEDIARDLGVSRAWGYKLLEQIRRDWQTSTIRDFDSLKIEELKRIDAVEAEYWSGWKNSLQDRKINETRNSKGKLTTLDRSESMAGNPAFLDGVMKCIVKRCEILGINAPDFSIHLQIDWEKLTDDQLQQIRSGVDPRKVIDVTPTERS